MYKSRTLENKIKELSEYFKVLLVTGARQVGKTTLLRHCDEKRNYVTLDDLNAREMAIENPALFLQKYETPLIIDEFQYAPNLLSYIKIIVDNSDLKGQYWLTGSQKFQMMKNVSESLTGRIGILELHGLSLKEMSGIEQEPFFPTMDWIKQMKSRVPSAFTEQYNYKKLYEIIWKGSYPEIYNEDAVYWENFYMSYLLTYVERDVRALSVVKNELDFFKFLKVLAARTGQVLNYADMANEIGISVPTAKAWVSVLVSSNIIYLLQPYFSNLNKRILKTPKVYFMDTGLCSYLTNLDSPTVLENSTLNGAMLETFVIGEIIKSYKHQGEEANIYYYRDKDKREIDIIIEKNQKLYPCEIKKTSNPNKQMIKNFSIIPEDRLGSGALLCLSQDYYPITEKVTAVPVYYI